MPGVKLSLGEKCACSGSCLVLGHCQSVNGQVRLAGSQWPKAGVEAVAKPESGYMVATWHRDLLLGTGLASLQAACSLVGPLGVEPSTNGL